MFAIVEVAAVLKCLVNGNELFKTFPTAIHVSVENKSYYLKLLLNATT